MLWFILEEYMGYLQSGQTFKPIPEVKSETEEANETEGEDLIDALSKSLEFAPPFSTLESCRDSGFLIKPNYIKEVVSGLKKEQNSLASQIAACSRSSDTGDIPRSRSGIRETVTRLSIPSSG
jgi:hypothetical protein